MKTSRRDFLAQAALAPVSLSALLENRTTISPADSPGAYSINIFSKNLHWLDYQSMAKTVKSMGYDGIDLTVRPEGHVIPERVQTDLPKAVEIIRSQGLQVYMITTAITKVSDPFAETIIKTAGALKIPFYRLGWIPYDDKIGISDDLMRIKRQLSELALLNKKNGIEGHYQNHSGTNFGAPVWDLGTALNEINSKFVGSQYDILHAVVEGTNAWPLGLRLISPHVRTMDIKDFQWVQRDGKWHEQTVPLGQGLIDCPAYFAKLKDYQVRGPFSMHFEYALGGAENGARTLTVDKDQVIDAMTRDLATFKQMIATSGLK